MGIKAGYPELGMLGQKIAPEEIDRYETYTIVNPSTSATWFGTFPVAGTAATGTAVFINAIADYPRNVQFVLVGTGAGMAGTMTLYGTNQFGGSINEVFGFGSADNGGTVVGTKIFAQLSAGTLLFGTAVGNGTAKIGVGTLGTTTLFGLPFKVGGTTDLKSFAFGTNHITATVNGGTIAAFIDKTVHAIKSPLTIAGTSSHFQVWVRPTYDAKADPNMANLSQRV